MSTHVRYDLAFRSERQLLKDQLDRNIATNGIGVGTDRVGKRDQFFAYGPLDSRQLDVQLDLKRKSTTSCGSNPDFGGDHRGACIEMLATCSPHESGLEPGGITRSEELFRIRSQVACAVHLPRHAQLHFESTIPSSCLSLPPPSHGPPAAFTYFHL